jgi:Calx-beta domain-containing protein
MTLPVSRLARDMLRHAARLLFALPAVVLAASVTYQYDNLGRVKAVVYDDGTRSDFVFDSTGNRTSVTSSGPTGSVQLTAATASIAENGGSLTVTVSRTGGAFGAASVNYGTSNGTATAGSDFTTTSGTLNWSTGDSANKTFNIPIIDDSVYEGNETFTVTLSGASGSTAGSPSTMTITINENEVAQYGTLSLSPATYSVLEGATTVTVSVTRAGGTDGPVSVQYAASNGTAASGSDFTATSGTLNWALGDSATKTFSVTILDDSAAEPGETINLALSSPTGGAVIGTGSGTITINDNEPGTLAMSSSSYSLAENGGSVTVSVTRTGGSYGAASVNYSTSAGSAVSGSDYTAVSGTLNWASGDSATKTFSIPIIDNSAFEATESFSTSISGASGASLGSPSSATVTITDNDPPIPGTLSLSPASYSVLEGATTVTVTVARTSGFDNPVSVQYATSNGSAAAGSDYTAASGTLNWGNGDSSSKSFSVTILNDSAYESSETINLSLSNAGGGASLGTSSGSITISDDEPGTLQFTSSSSTVVESGGSVTFTVSRVNGAYGAVSVNYATANGTAVSGSDYTATSGTLNWANGNTATKTFTVSIGNDSTWESAETFTANLSGAGGGATVGSPSTHTVTITDDDGPSIPANLRTNPNQDPTIGNFSVVWDASAGGVTYYVLEKDLLTADWVAPNYTSFTVNAPATSQAFTVTGSLPKTFQYRVKACTPTQCSPWSPVFTHQQCGTASCGQ